ncbi:MAG: hypothetical protein AB7G93_14995 [Bdellovibrionales bacterium]
MLTTKLIEKIMADVADRTSARSKLLLTQLDMAYPPSESKMLVRKAVLNTLGDSGLLPEIRAILLSHSVAGTGVDHA